MAFELVLKAKPQKGTPYLLEQRPRFHVGPFVGFLFTAKLALQIEFGSLGEDLGVKDSEGRLKPRNPDKEKQETSLTQSSLTRRGEQIWSGTEPPAFLLIWRKTGTSFVIWGEGEGVFIFGGRESQNGDVVCVRENLERTSNLHSVESNWTD